MPGSRPFGVSLLSVLIVVGGIVYILGGIAMAILGASAGTGAIVVASGIIIALVGVIYLLVARGLRHGSRGARLVVTVVTILSLISASIQLVQPNGLWPGLIGIGFSLIVLALLFSRRAALFFR